MNWQKKRRNKSFNSLEPMHPRRLVVYIFFCYLPSRKTNFLRESLFIFHSMWQKYILYTLLHHIYNERWDFVHWRWFRKTAENIGIDQVALSKAHQTRCEKKKRFMFVSFAAYVTKRKGLTTTPTHAELGNRVTQTLFSCGAVKLFLHTIEQ